jgi:hypothetical protein
LQTLGIEPASVPAPRHEEDIMTAVIDLTESQKTLIDNLSRELFQTETSAARHCVREADRLGSTPPALALRAVSDHAKKVLEQLPSLAERNGMVVSKGGIATGELFSQLRDKLADLFIDSERSYRGTMLGCRHGMDVVRLLLQVAVVLGNEELDNFCTAWLNTRSVLVQQLEEELAWFAKHPAEAVANARF